MRSPPVTRLTVLVEAGASTSEGRERCTWCGEAVERDDGFRLAEPAGTGDEPLGARRAVFCRLEHVVPWVIQGAHWEPGALGEPPELDEAQRDCAHCGEPLPELHLLLVRHRGDHRIPDAFCSIDHLSAWAKAGGRWR